MKKIFSPKANKVFLNFQKKDRQKFDKINALLADIEKNGVDKGLGKPEALKHKEGCYSRHIDKKNRLVYKVKDDTIFVFQCALHYDDK
jgi:toxin YoeB